MIYVSKIPHQWEITNGSNINVGIIDCGFDVNNKYLKPHIYSYIDYGKTDIDHGTHVMGIMCLHNCPQVDCVKGLAFDSKYYLASIPMGQEKGMKSLCKVLQKFLDYDLQVINMSFTNYCQNQRMKQLLYQLYKKNTILVSSYSETILYPHSYSFVVSAGYQLGTQNSFKSCISNNKFKIISGTSMQSAYISSVAALAKSFNKKIDKKQFVNTITIENQKTVQTKSRNRQYSLRIK